MVRRELRTVQGDRVVGAVEVLDGGRSRFDGQAAEVFARLRARLGDDQAAHSLLAEGWSNGYLYLAEA